MAILIDPPRWPAHGTLWSHLVSDQDYDELHTFAAQLALPRRSFDLDHYDVPASLHAQAIQLGALAVDAREVVYRLRDSGLRVRHIDRDTLRPVRRRQYLIAEWAALGTAAGVVGSLRQLEAWQHLGDELIARWNEPHRRYHDEVHLEDVLLALDHLAVRGERVAPTTLLAAWFHDAIYQGTATDEEDSAAFAMKSLQQHGLDTALTHQVGAAIVATKPQNGASSSQFAHLLDADLAIFGASERRYERYTAAVRAEYAHLPDHEFCRGRAEILQGYLGTTQIYRTTAARDLWESRARMNLEREFGLLVSVRDGQHDESDQNRQHDQSDQDDRVDPAVLHPKSPSDHFSPSDHHSLSDRIKGV